MVRRRQQTREVLDMLRARWPEAFGTPVPLASGIAREIRQVLGEEMRVPAAHLGWMLHFWINGSGYLVVVATGRRRVHLDGSDAGEPDEAVHQQARDTLAQRAARHRAMRDLGIPRLRNPEFTASRRESGERVEVADAALLPAGYVRTRREPDKVALLVSVAPAFSTDRAVE